MYLINNYTVKYGRYDGVREDFLKKDFAAHIYGSGPL